MEETNQQERNRRPYVLAAGGAVFTAAFLLSQFGAPSFFALSYERVHSAAALNTSTAHVVRASHLKTPEPVKGIYMSQCIVATPALRDKMVQFAEDNGLNTLIIDIRDYTGKISFETDNPVLAGSVSDACRAKDMKEFIERVHDKGIYVIGRITTFQNPYYTSLHPEHAVQKKCAVPSSTSTESCGVWKDYKGLSFVDVGAKPYWDEVVELGRISYEEVGFDEINFDYIRYPSDGPMKEAYYSWSEGRSGAEVLEEFYVYLTGRLRQTGAVLSVDLFGMTATNEDDLGIGQVLERALPYFDYIDPMVYPSHYPKNFNGYADVNAHPYDIVRYAMDTAVARTVATTTPVAALAHRPIFQTVIVPATADTATTTKEIPTGLYTKTAYAASKIRPWLQSFDYPVPYTPEMVRAQIQATYDAGLTSFLMWDAANKYRSLPKALEDAGATSMP